MKNFVVSTAALLTLGGLLLACTNSEDAVREAEDEVFTIHDQVMPRISDMMKLRKQLDQRIRVLDSTAATGSAAATLRTDEDNAQARRLSRDLVVADSLMVNWMAQYNNDTLAKLPSAEALRYLADQKNQIIDVRAKIITSIEQARRFLENP